MLKNAKNFKTLITETEFEALLLEAEFIKSYQPKYNLLLKDDRSKHGSILPHTRNRTEQTQKPPEKTTNS